MYVCIMSKKTPPSASCFNGLRCKGGVKRASAGLGRRFVVLHCAARCLVTMNDDDDDDDHRRLD